MADKNIYALALGMPQDKDENEVVNHIQNLVRDKATLTASLQTKDTEIAGLKNELKAFKAAKVTALINQAIASKKFGEDERETYTNLAEQDFEGVEKIINKLPGVDPIAGKLAGRVESSGAFNKRIEEIKKNLKK